MYASASTPLHTQPATLLKGKHYTIKNTSTNTMHTQTQSWENVNGNQWENIKLLAKRGGLKTPWVCPCQNLHIFQAKDHF
jgi:hypothetical protein